MCIVLTGEKQLGDDDVLAQGGTGVEHSWLLDRCSYTRHCFVPPASLPAQRKAVIILSLSPPLYKSAGIDLHDCSLVGFPDQTKNKVGKDKNRTRSCGCFFGSSFFSEHQTVVCIYSFTAWPHAMLSNSDWQDKVRGCSKSLHCNGWKI